MCPFPNLDGSINQCRYFSYYYTKPFKAIPRNSDIIESFCPKKDEGCLKTSLIAYASV